MIGAVDAAMEGGFPVRRQYQPEPSALNALVEVLYVLLLETPPALGERAFPPGSPCFPLPPE